jgi:hypothetical protein
MIRTEGQDKSDFIQVGMFLVYLELLSKTSGTFLALIVSELRCHTPHTTLVTVYPKYAG